MRYLPRLLSFLAAFIAIALSFGTSNPVAAASLILPAGFADQTLYSGLLAPRAFTFLPDGRILVVERGDVSTPNGNLGSIRVIKNGAILPTPAYVVSTCGDSERGLLGIVADPQFESNGYIYIYYTRQATSGAVCGKSTFITGDNNGPRNRISRLTMSGDTAGSERVLIDSIITEQGNHNAGDLHFGTDGYLYASTGDGALSWTSPDKNTLNGKIIRILPTAGDAGGYTTAGNPYDAEAGARTCQTIAAFTQGTSPGTCREIFARGFRNPFRFTMQPAMAGIPGTGDPFVGDAGQNTWEEVDQVHAGGDYGWPVREGFCAKDVLCSPPYQAVPYDNPLYAYSHIVNGSSVSSVIVGGDFYTGGADYPAQYLNNYFFVEFQRGFIGRLIYSAGTWISPAGYFATNAAGIANLKRGPDGSLYYLTSTSLSTRIDGLHRIVYTNASPPRNYFTTDTPTLTWNRVSWATHYILQISNNTAFTGATVYLPGNNLELMLPSQPNGAYYWRVIACTDTSCGLPGVPDTFVVNAP